MVPGEGKENFNVKMKETKQSRRECEENATQIELLTLDAKSELLQKETKISESVHYLKDFRK